MNKENKTLPKKYPPELFDAIRKFLNFNSSDKLYNTLFMEILSKAIYIDEIVKLTLKDKSDKDSLGKRLINAAFEKQLVKAVFEKDLVDMAFGEQLVKATVKDKDYNDLLKENPDKNALKEKLITVALKNKLLKGVFTDKLLITILKDKPDKNVFEEIVTDEFIEKLVKAITNYGFVRKDILKVFEIVKLHDTEEDQLEIEKLTFEKPLIVPPGLNSAYLHFEAHFAVSGDDPIMILGPTGVGKSMFLYLARRLFKKKHQYDTTPPIIVEANCAHFSSGDGGYSLARSELFGHVKGSFTGADNNKVGLVEKANGGLLILEEVGELPREVQAMLLTFIETGAYRRLGDETVKTASVKVVAATNRELALRDDFRYRFFPYYIPPLRERKIDILYYFHEIFPELTQNLSKSEILLLLTHHWPGNVREIERIGRLIKRENWINEQVLKDSRSDTMVPPIERIFHLDPRDTSFDPNILERLVYDLESWDIDVSFLDKLFQKHRVSIIEDETNLKAFKELSVGPESGGYFSAFTSDTLILPNDFKPFDEAYEGYLLFCDLFMQDPKKDDNILATIKNQCTSSAFNHMRYCFDDKPSYQRPLKNLRKKIMKCLMEFDSPEYDHIDDPWEFWSILEQTDPYKDLFSADFESEEIQSAISELKEVELLKLYYRKQLEITGGNIKAAAKRVGLKENTFRSRLTKLGIAFKKI